MLNPEDRRAIEGLFDRLAAVERDSPARDAEAEQLIRDEIGRQSGAPYYMAQTILVQEQALETARERIQQLEARQSRVPQTGGSRDRDAAAGGGGFLAGAAQTALGVTGGMMLGSLIGSMFGGGHAVEAAETPAQPEPDNPGDDADFGTDDFAGDDGGGFDGGGFDFGGDF